MSPNDNVEHVDLWIPQTEESGIDTVRLALEDELTHVVAELRELVAEMSGNSRGATFARIRHRAARLLSRVATAQETLCILRPTAPPQEGGTS